MKELIGYILISPVVWAVFSLISLSVFESKTGNKFSRKSLLSGARLVGVMLTAFTYGILIIGGVI